MTEAVARQEPEADTARVQPRVAQSQPPQVAVVPAGSPQAAPIPPPRDTEAELAAPLDKLPKFQPFKDFPFTKPVTNAKGEEVKGVRLRAPTGLDLFEVGGPPTRTIWVQGGMQIEMDAERFRAWLGRLAIECDIPTLYRCSARDVRTMYEWLNGELNPAGN